MTDYSSAYPTGMSLYIEISVAVMITAVFLISSLLSLKERHRDASAWHVHVGAVIYGAVFGLVVGFVIVPLRIVLMQGELPPQTVALSGFGFLFIVIALRRGLIGRLPFLGPQVKAYRRAALRRTIEAAQKQLDKLTPNSEP